MKARLIKEAQAFNPEYDREDAAVAKQEQRDYEHPQIITRPVGHIQNHPDAWKNCVNGHLNSPPIAVPEDDECKSKVREWMNESPKRIERLSAYLKSTEPRSEAGRRFFEALRKNYAAELSVADPETFDDGASDEVHEEEDYD